MNIIELAREAGVAIQVHKGQVGGPWDSSYIITPDLERFAHLVRAAALEEAAGVTGEFAQKWWSIHCASNKHMETTRKAHDDFCALQAAIRARLNLTEGS